MYIIGSDYNISNIKKYNRFDNETVNFLHIDALTIQKTLNYLKLSQFLNVNYKKVNIIMYEIVSRIVLSTKITSCFLIVINGVIIHNNGQNLILYPLSSSYYFNLKKILKNTRKLREVTCIIYSVDSYSLISKIYKNKIIVQKNNIIDKVGNLYSVTTDSTRFLLTSNNLFINNYSGEFLLNYENSKCCLLVQKIIDQI